MSYDSASFSQHSVLSPPLLAAIDSQHIFGSYDAAHRSSSLSSRNANHRSSVDVSTAASHDQPSTASHHRRTRSRALSAASVNNLGSNSTTALSSLQQHHHNGNSNSQRRTRRVHHGHSNRHSRNGSRSGPIPTSRRSVTLNVQADSAGFEESRPLSGSLRNRSTPHLDGLRSLSVAQEECHLMNGGRVSALTAPSSPQLSAGASMSLAMSSVSQASALMLSEWTHDGFAPTSPRPNLSHNASDDFDPASLAQLQSQNGSAHPELRAGSGGPDPSPSIDSVFDRLSPHPTSHHAARSGSQSEWVQHAAHMQQTAHLLGLQRLFASRSTPHLPDLDSSYLGHDFESPPPYAPRASALETELGRAADISAPGSLNHNSEVAQHRHTSNSSSASTIFNGNGNNDPPLPPPISIPTSTGGHAASGPPSASASASTSARPSLRARSSSRGSRSGPSSPSASFYGRRGLTSLSPLPVGLEMTPSVMHVAHFSSTPASPGFAADSDGDEDLDGALSFSPSRSKQRRDERRQTIASMDNASGRDLANGVFSASLPGSSAQAQAQAALSRRRRSGSAGSVRQLLRPRTPINSSVPHAATHGSAHVFSEEVNAPSDLPESDTHRNGLTSSRPIDHATPVANRQSTSHRSHDDTDYDAEQTDQPVSPNSDSTRPESPSSPDASPGFSRSNPFASSTGRCRTVDARDTSPTKSAAANATVDEDDEEEFSLVLKLLLHPLRILAAVPGCIGTFWLARNAWVLATRQGRLLSPGQMLITHEGTNHFWSADLSSPPVFGPLRLGRRQPGSLDFAVAGLWSMSTAYHALSFTTLLLRRWLLYYSILPSLIRLVALQAICWPLVRLTVHVFGPDQPLGAWVVIGTTTALSDVVSRWVTSNIADAPLDDELDEEEQEEAEETLGYLSDSRFVKSPRVSATERLFRADSHPHAASSGKSLISDSDWDPRSGDESDAAAATFFANERERQRKQRRGGQGTRFWRAVIGGPSFASSSRGRKKVENAGGGVTETEMEEESDWPGYGTDGTVVGGAARSRLGLQNDVLRRRWPASTSPPSVRGGGGVVEAKKTELPPFPSKPSTYRQGSSRHTRYVYKDGAWVRERTSSRRTFHWEVAVWRNVLPIAVLSYLSMWILVLDAMRLGG
ncbi:hypothetical protein NDA18_000509 [Ustilago nuda]|nr:hypothetical protein NDA18_000509 [Ustilago nuda]